MVLISIPIVFTRYWPRAARPYLPLYWFVALTINLPAFFTYMLVMGQFSPVGMTSQLAALYLILMVFDYRASVASFILGVSLAVACVWFVGPPTIPFVDVVEMTPVWFFMLLTGSLFNISGTIEYQARLNSVIATTATIAHELRTPLSTIRVAAMGSSRNLPILVDAYRAARKAGLDVPLLQPGAVRAIGRFSHATLQKEVDPRTAVTIDMLLASARAGSCPRRWK